MLEAASTLVRSRCLRNRHSIIFVALDQEEQGCLGSLEFVRSYLAPDFPQGPQGAFVLDTLANWAGAKERSQSVPEEWDRLAPEAARSIREHGERVSTYVRTRLRFQELILDHSPILQGDFLGIVTRASSPSESRLSASFSRFHGRLRPDRFRLEHFDLRGLPSDRMPNLGELFSHRYFWRSDNARFWYHQEETNGTSVFKSIGAALITDTGEKRETSSPV